MPAAVFVTTSGMTLWAFMRGQLIALGQRSVRVIAMSAGDRYLDQLAALGIETHALPLSRDRRSVLADITSLFKLLVSLRRIRPRLIHASTPKAALFGLLAAKLVGVPIRVFFVRGTLSPRYQGIKGSVVRVIEKATAALATHTVCVSNSVLSYMRDEGIIQEGSGVVLGSGMSNGVDLQRFLREREPRTDHKFVVGCVGRIARHKGIPEVLQAWREIREVIPESQLLVVGPVDHADPVSSENLLELQSDTRITFVGEVADVAPWYNEMDVILLLTHGSEGFPNVPMEAAGAGVPCIGTRIIGTVDAVIDGETGVLVQPGDIPGVVTAVQRYAANRQLLRAHGANAQRRVAQEFAQEIVWAHHLAFICSHLGIDQLAGAAKPTQVD